jgi:membrane-associated phospholipid phosphatase
VNRQLLAILGWVCVLAAFVAVVILAFMAYEAPPFPIDMDITLAVQRLNSPNLDTAAWVIDWPGSLPQVIVILVVISIALYRTGYRWEAVVLWLANILEAGIAVGLKYIIRRPRPVEGMGIVIYKDHSDFGFPSGHNFSYMMIFGLLAYYCYRLMKPSWLRTVLIVVMIAMVVVSGPIRIYFGAHWPSDVLAGYLLGVVALPLMIQVYHWGQGRFFKSRAVSPKT